MSHHILKKLIKPFIDTMDNEMRWNYFQTP